jgi:hypothetical protein
MMIHNKYTEPFDRITFMQHSRLTWMVLGPIHAKTKPIFTIWTALMGFDHKTFYRVFLHTSHVDTFIKNFKILSIPSIQSIYVSK